MENIANHRKVFIEAVLKSIENYDEYEADFFYKKLAEQSSDHDRKTFTEAVNKNIPKVNIPDNCLDIVYCKDCQHSYIQEYIDGPPKLECNCEETKPDDFCSHEVRIYEEVE